MSMCFYDHNDSGLNAAGAIAGCCPLFCFVYCHISANLPTVFVLKCKRQSDRPSQSKKRLLLVYKRAPSHRVVTVQVLTHRWLLLSSFKRKQLGLRQLIGREFVLLFANWLGQSCGFGEEATYTELSAVYTSCYKCRWLSLRKVNIDTNLYILLMAFYIWTKIFSSLCRYVLAYQVKRGFLVIYQTTYIFFMKKGRYIKGF